MSPVGVSVAISRRSVAPIVSKYVLRMLRETSMTRTFPCVSGTIDDRLRPA